MKEKTIALILIIILTITVVIGATSYAGMGFGFIIMAMVLLWGVIIWQVISLINAGTKKSEETPESALAILKKRYARGEITREQYLEMEKDLMG